jgi:hypothetical protein
MAFNPDIATRRGTPVSRNPAMIVGPGRHDICARDPNVTAAIPAMIAGNPYVTWARRRSRTLDNNRRRTDAHIYLRICGTDGECKAK